MEESKQFTELSNESLEQVSGGWEPEVRKPYINNTCAGCGTCIDVCPTRAIVEDGHIYKIEQDKCNCCERCMPECPVGAINY